MIYQRISVARNGRAYLTTLAIKRGVLRNFEKNLRAAILWDIVEWIFSYY